MKNLLRNVILKKFITVLIIVIVGINSIIPTNAYAISISELFQDATNKIVNGIFYFATYIGDVVMEVMQGTFMGRSTMNAASKYYFYYAPAAIFMDKVPMFDINFFAPKTYSFPNVSAGGSFAITSEYNNDNIIENVLNRMKNHEIEVGQDIYLFLESDGYEKTEKILETKDYRLSDYIGYIHSNDPNGSRTWDSYSDFKEKAWLGTGTLDFVGVSIRTRGNEIWIKDNTINIIVWQVYDYIGQKLYTYKIFSTELNNTERQHFSNISVKTETDEDYTIESIASKLQSNIAKWYVAMRTIALVGLLSVLLYIGIQIVLKSTSSQDKAKYKNMLKDWLVGVCILFVLHYVMVYMLEFRDSLNNIIGQNIMHVNDYGLEYDKLMSDLRNSYFPKSGADSMINEITAGQTIMYISLVILTIIFTVQYLKRVVFMAFLTMISPLIALTYPIDKIKDGKAQAFSYWLREYIFNCLIQPVHALLYAIFIYSAMAYVQDNIIYAIVAMAFMVPAEKIIKEMFGMKSQSPTNNLGAAAGGAMVMNMINKLRGIGPKGEKGKTEGSGERTGIRTASRSSSRSRSSFVSSSSEPFSSEKSSAASKGSESLGPAPTGPKTSDSEPTDPAPTGPAPTDSAPLFSSPAGMGGYDVTNLDYKSAGEMAKGIAGLGGEVADFAVTKGLGLVGAGLAGTVALASQVATGDLFENPDKALTAVGIGAAAGYAGGQGLAKGVGQIPGNIKNVSDAIDKATMTTEAYNNKKFDEKFYKSEGYKMMSQDRDLVKMYGNEKGLKLATQQFLDNGITDSAQIRKALQAGVNGDAYKKFTKNGVTDVKDMTKLQEAGVDVETYDKFAHMGIKDASKIINAMNYLGTDSGGRARSPETIAGLAKLAQFAGVKKDKDEFLKFATSVKIEDKTVTPEEAEDVYKNLINLV